MENSALSFKKIFLLMTVVMVFFSGCHDDMDDLTEQYPFLEGIVEVPTETLCGVTPKKVKFLAGQHIEAGEVEIRNDLKNLYITVNTKNSWFFGATHIYVGSKANLPVGGGGNPKVGNFPYKSSHDPLVQSYLLTIPLDKLEPCFVIAVHAEAYKLDDKGKVVQKETAWAEGEQITASGSWAMNLDYCLEECVIKYPIEAVATLAFEDLYPIKGDADYNDMVLDMSAKQYYTGKQIKRIEMEFNLKARGTIYDHEFAIRVPLNGSANVKIERFNATDAQAVETENMLGVGGENLKIVVFPSTKLVLPVTQGHFSSNTLAGTLLKTSTTRTKVTIYVEEGHLILNAPFDPYLHVKETDQKIHIIEITQKIDADGDGNRDYWEDEEGIHPFGIIMHKDWQWPLEYVNILEVYPEFKYVIEGGRFKAKRFDWYKTPTEGSGYFRPELFN